MTHIMHLHKEGGKCPSTSSHGICVSLDATLGTKTASAAATHPHMQVSGE